MIDGRFDLVRVLVDSEPIVNPVHSRRADRLRLSDWEQDLAACFCGMSDPEMLGVIERGLGRALKASYGERVAVMIENEFRGFA